MGSALPIPCPQKLEEILQQYDSFEMTQQYIADRIQASILWMTSLDSWQRLCNPPNSTQKLESIKQSGGKNFEGFKIRAGVIRPQVGGKKSHENSYVKTYDVVYVRCRHQWTRPC